MNSSYLYVVVPLNRPTPSSNRQPQGLGAILRTGSQHAGGSMRVSKEDRGPKSNCPRSIMHMRDEGLLEPRSCPILELVTRAHAGRWSQQKVRPVPAIGRIFENGKGRALTGVMTLLLDAVAPERSPEERAPNVTYQETSKQEVTCW